MAARRRPSPSGRRRRQENRQPVKKTPPVQKKVAKKKPAPRPARVTEGRSHTRAFTAGQTSRSPPAPAPLAGEETHRDRDPLFRYLSVAAVRMESGSLRVGDTIMSWAAPATSASAIESMQVEHAPVSEVRAGQEFGLKVTGHARENDIVYRAAAPQP